MVKMANISLEMEEELHRVSGVSGVLDPWFTNFFFGQICLHARIHTHTNKHGRQD